jgi:hypothetical protein
MLIYIIFVNIYILYIKTPIPNTNRHVHAHKCLHCPEIEPATSCEYFHHYATSAVAKYRDMSTKYRAMRNIADVTSGNSIGILSQAISGVSAVNPLFVLRRLNDIHGWKEEVLYFCSVKNTTRDNQIFFYY